MLVIVTVTLSAEVMLAGCRNSDFTSGGNACWFIVTVTLSAEVMFAGCGGSDVICRGNVCWLW